MWSTVVWSLNVKIWGNRFALADSIHCTVKSISQQANRVRGRGGEGECVKCSPVRRVSTEVTFWHSAEYGSDFRRHSGEIPRNSAEFRGISPEFSRNHFRSQKIPRNSVSAEFRGHPTCALPTSPWWRFRAIGCVPPLAHAQI